MVRFKILISSLLFLFLLFNPVFYTITADEIVPDEIVLDEIVPDEIVPDEIVPDEIVPDEIVPDEIVPDEIVPDEIVPDEIVPDEIVSDEIVPDEIVPDEIVSDEIVPDEIFSTSSIFTTDEIIFTGGFEILGNSTIFEDDFNSYNDGALAGQGGWTGDSGNIYTIQTTTKFEGAKGVKVTNAGGTQNIKKSGTLRNAGTLTWYFKQDRNDTWTYIHLTESGVNKVSMGLFTGAIFKYNASDGQWYAIPTADAFVTNTWFQLDIEWRSSDKYVRYSVKATTEGIGVTPVWSNWFAPRINYTNGLDGVSFIYNDQAKTPYNGYLDYIAENPYAPPPEENIFYLNNFLGIVFLYFIFQYLTIFLFDSILRFRDFLNF